ncbi:MAG: divergent PAP2 family protein [Chloroflexi bacterium]|nr:divergent PAP2 family protein [Chloroflexota bacterium]
MLGQILGNKMVTASVVAWMTAQLLKTLIDAARYKRLNLRLLAGTGGMPSAHSALVCALATTAGKTQGFGSPLFAITLILAAIVMYDAVGVRQAVDKQSEILTHLLNHIPRTQDDFDRFLEGLVGHTRFQVLAGAMLGIAIGSAWL